MKAIIIACFLLGVADSTWGEPVVSSNGLAALVISNTQPMTFTHDGNIAVGLSSNGVIYSSRLEWQPTQATSCRFRSLCYGTSNFVAVGSSGRIATSADGLQWSEIRSPVKHSLYSVAYGAETFVAVGNEGVILQSQDGFVWTPALSGTDTRLRGIAFGNNEFVAVGYEGVILSSRDGSRWRVRSSGTEERLQSIAFGNGKFVIVGWNGTILRGGPKRWLSAESEVRVRFGNVAYERNLFRVIASDATLSSSDGIKWAFE